MSLKRTPTTASSQQSWRRAVPLPSNAGARSLGRYRKGRFLYTSPTARGGGPTRLGALVVGVLALLTTSPARAELRPYTEKPTLTLRALPVIADPHQVNKAVRYAGGYELIANGTEQFHGLSDLSIIPQASGLRVEAISDLGAAIGFDLRQNTPIDIGHLKGPDGKASFSRVLADAEDTAIDLKTGIRYVSYERSHRITAFTNGWASNGQVLPLSGLPAFPTNEGLEGLTLAGDALLAGAESGGFWLCPLTTYKCRKLEAPDAPGFMYKLTSLEALDPEGREVLALYRYFTPFTGVKSWLRLLKRDGDRLTVAEDVLKIAPPMPADNYEGVSAIKTAGGYRLYLICDNLEEDGKPKILIYDWTR